MLTFITGPGAAPRSATEFADFDTGQAIYRVTGIGAFTLGWDPLHAEADVPPAEEILQVAFGAGTFSWDMPEAPVLFGVILAGRDTFTRSQLEARELRLRPHRFLLSAHVRVPSGTARRASAIVRALASHWLAQTWTADLRRAHEHHCAPHSLSRYAHHVADHEQQMERLRAHHAFAIDRAERAARILQAGPVAPPEDAPPHPFAAPEPEDR